MSWVPTRSAGIERLEAFLPRAGSRYRAARNYDYGPGKPPAVSGLSPYLRCRLLSEREVISRVLDVHSAAAADKFIQEVCWRCYWKGWLEQHPEAWVRYQSALSEAFEQLATDDDLQLRFSAAVGGATGIDAFDAWVGELEATGYLHNHARMWFASIWIFTLELPWVLGADYFLRRLLDGDQASNTLSWRWVAGLHTRGKTYLARADNIRRYTEERFHSLQGLAQRAEPLDEAPVPFEALELPSAQAPAGARYALLLTDEDLTLPRALEPVAIAGMLTAPRRSSQDLGPLVLEFAQGALDDALERGARQYGAPSEAAFAATEQDGVVRWAQDLGVDSVVVNYQPVGPARSQLEALETRLAECGITVAPLLGDLDRRAWPAADKGYYKLRKRIPELLSWLAAQPAAGLPAG